MKIFVSAVMAATILIGLPADATTRAVTCDACSPNQMADLATRTIDQGTVYVFDADFARVGKYAVVREVLDVEPREVWVQANPLSVEKSIRKAWSAYLDESGTLEDEAVIDLPVDFGIRSVAGALQSPGFSTTSIEDFLASWSSTRRMEMEFSTIVGQMIRKNVPFVDLQDLIQTFTITVRFPDGSTQDYSVAFSVNAITGNSRLELSVFGNPRTADGQPAPTSRIAFNGRTFDDRHGALIEWILWARHLGLIVTGKGSTMTCAVEGSEIFCRLVKRP